MLKHVVAVSIIALCCATAAMARPNDQPATNAASAAAAAQTQTNLPPVDTMTCDQMQAEMTTSGQTMQRQLDPQFGVEAQAMHDEAQQRQREAAAQAPVNALACLIPFACAAVQQHQQQVSQAEAARNQARMQAQMDRLHASMNGLDQDRMQAISTRWQSLHCQMPQGSQH